MAYDTDMSAPDKITTRGFVCAMLLSLACLCGCTSLQKKPPHIPFHTLYQEVVDDEALAFLGDGIAYLKRHHGPLKHPVNEVYLLYSRKNAIGSGYKIAEEFSKAEIVDASSGRFAIYIGVPPSHPEFFPLLAHEIGHLKAPSRVDDWEMEGFCMLFSEQLCEALGYDWHIWRKRFTEDSDDPYARAYHQAKALE